MAKYNPKSVYGTLFVMLDNLSQENQDYLMENVFDSDFLNNIQDNPSKAYNTLNEIVVNIEDGKTDKVSKLLSDYKDKIYMMKNMLKDYGNFKEKKIMKIKEYFDYKGELPIETIKEIMTDEWQDYNNGLFGESSHYEDEATDENKYITVTAIVPFDTSESTGYSFTNKKVEKDYIKECNEIYVDVDGDAEEYFDIISQYEPILFVLNVDLKDEIMYADVDLGNNLSSTEVAREKLPTDENEFRKAVKRMIDAF